RAVLLPAPDVLEANRGKHLVQPAVFIRIERHPAGVEDDSVSVSEVQPVVHERERMTEDVLMEAALRPLAVVPPVRAVPDEMHVDVVLVENPAVDAEVDGCPFEDHGPVARAIAIVEPV